MARLDGRNGPVITDSLTDEIGTRRLSDKILSAFNHAYATGEREIAGLLRQVLEAHENMNEELRDRRAGFGPLSQADMWVDFVEARNHYKGVSASSAADEATAVVAMEAMKEAYKRWSLS